MQVSPQQNQENKGIEFKKPQKEGKRIQIQSKMKKYPLKRNKN